MNNESISLSMWYNGLFCKYFLWLSLIRLKSARFLDVCHIYLNFLYDYSNVRMCQRMALNCQRPTLGVVMSKLGVWRDAEPITISLRTGVWCRRGLEGIPPPPPLIPFLEVCSWIRWIWTVVGALILWGFSASWIWLDICSKILGANY